MNHEDSIEIAVDPEVAFDAIADLPGMGRFSPENTGGRWVRGASGPALGARFKGTNVQGKKEWSTTAKVASFDRPRHFAFEITVASLKIARWEFEVEPTSEGSKVTERWTDRRSSFVKRFGAIEGIDDRDAYTRESIRSTLSALKVHLEQQG